jgi:transcriptional regulator GlxA family with amidase domain
LAGHAGHRRHGRWLEQQLRNRCSQRITTACRDLLRRTLARGRLLTNRRCTTHHELLPQLRALARSAQVIDNRVFVVDGPVASSAGITAGIDLALHLIAEECGEALAASVAEDMVVYLRRSQRDPELSPFLAHRRHLHPVVHRVQDAIITRPEHDWDMATLAAIGHATERHLLRLFVDMQGPAALSAVDPARAAGGLSNAAASPSRGRRGLQSSLQLRRAQSMGWLTSGRVACGGARRLPTNR